jgi:hypothetical protein
MLCSAPSGIVTFPKPENSVKRDGDLRILWRFKLNYRHYWTASWNGNSGDASSSGEPLELVYKL